MNGWRGMAGLPAFLPGSTMNRCACKPADRTSVPGILQLSVKDIDLVLRSGVG
jgi:hypothetical protein